MTYLSNSIAEPGPIQFEGLGKLPAPAPLQTRPPRLIEADDLAALNKREDVLIVDVRTREQCVDGHIPGAVMLNYPDLVAPRGPAAGLLPNVRQLSRVFSSIGLHPGRRVVAYDDDSGVHAARLLWTLDVIGHQNHSLLHGGFAAWDDLELPLADTPARPDSNRYAAVVEGDNWADFDYVKAALGDPQTILLDTRTPGEYGGETVRAARGGHIPGAVNFEWVQAIDLTDNGRLRDARELSAALGRLGVTPDREVIAYCHTHHRSSHTYLVLKHLGFPNVRAYAGSWSEWGNRPDAPIEC